MSLRRGAGGGGFFFATVDEEDDGNEETESGLEKTSTISKFGRSARFVIDLQRHGSQFGTWKYNINSVYDVASCFQIQFGVSIVSHAATFFLLSRIKFSRGHCGQRRLATFVKRKERYVSVYCLGYVIANQTF